MDDHLDSDGRVTPFAEHVLRRLASYSEVSPSGEGIKVFVRGSVEYSHADHLVGIEVYAGGRYFTVTGRKLSDSSDEVAGRQSELSALLSELKPRDRSSNTAAWRKLSNREKALAALAKLSPSRADGRQEWIAVGMALHSVDDSLADEWDRWSLQSPKHDADCCSRAWASFGNRCGYTLASLVYWANQDSPGWRDGYAGQGERTPINGSAAQRPMLTQAIVHRLSDVRPEQLEWLWPDRIPLGKLTLLAGDPGLGNSFVTCDLAARISSGRAWPDDSTWQQPAGSVVMFNCEDGLRDTVRPRLDRARADVSKIVAIDGVKVHDIDSGEARSRGFSLANDLPRLEHVVKDLTDCRLIVIDPVSAYCGDADSHKNAEVRALLAPLAELAERFRVAVLMVTHLAKGTGSKAIYRSMGSLAFAAAARAVWHVAKDPEDENRRLILPAKMNLAPDPTGLAYCLDQGVVCWEADPVKMHADELLAIEANAKPDTDRTQRDEATGWLCDVLANGPMPSKDIIGDGREQGHSEKTLRRAYKEMGGKPTKTGMDGGWLWSLPTATPPPDTDAFQCLADLDSASLFPPLAAKDGHALPKMPTP